MTRSTIHQLLSVPEEQHDLAWLHEALQWAVELEFATIPVYLSGMWSITGQSGPAYNLVNSVLMEEMLHLGLACNMLVAIGGTPRIVAPAYPGPLPGGVRPGLTVSLRGLTPETVEMYMAIELPEQPLTATGGETYPTIGAFYDAIAAAFANLSPALSTTGQIGTTLGVPDPNDPDSGAFVTETLNVLATLDDVRAAIETIKEQGEGTTQSPDAPQYEGGEIAHYYRFAEILHGKQLVEVDGRWEYAGADVPFPECHPVAEVPAGGYPGVPAVAAFDTAYADLVAGLQSAWSGGGDAALEKAIDVMESLTGLAATVVATPLPGGGGNYGPDFVPANAG